MLSVTLGTFTLVTNEFLPVGLLSDIRASMSVSEGVAGLSVTVPGITAALAAPLLTVAAKKLDRRLVLFAMSALFTLADVLAAIAPNFATMLVARFLLGLGIGGFWAIGASVASRLVTETSVPRATALIFSGVSIATVLGVPAGAFLGGVLGWRAAFIGTAALGALALILQLALLPRMVVDEAVTWRQLSSVLGGRNARVGLVVTLLLVVGQFAAYTYVTPFLEQETGADSGLISILLFVYGTAGILGTFAIGPALAVRLRRTLGIVVAVLAVTTLLMPLVGRWPVGAFAVLAAWGLAYGSVPLALQTWIFTADATRPEGGSALFISSFQVSIAIGSLLGGRIVDSGSAATPMYAGAILALGALLALLLFSRPVNAHPTPSEAARQEARQNA
ncbi:MFS transporter [Streptomyces mirabilis]|uniref:MFS transporter n=1 Tax=Streptomyces mirabilis TaxID=68239 RepID=UPI0036CC521B